MKPLIATLTKTYRDEPLVVVDNLPGGFAELRPAELRALARALAAMADDCEARPIKARGWAPARRQYGIDV